MSCNPKGFWKYVNSQLKTRPAINEIQLPNGTVTQDDLQKAEAFNQFLPVFSLRKLLLTCQAYI